MQGNRTSLWAPLVGAELRMRTLSGLQIKKNQINDAAARIPDTMNPTIPLARILALLNEDWPRKARDPRVPRSDTVSSADCRAISIAPWSRFDSAFQRAKACKMGRTKRGVRAWPQTAQTFRGGKYVNDSSTLCSATRCASTFVGIRVKKV
jgi:hypothetical protein